MKPRKLKKRTLLILSCLVTGNSLASDFPVLELETGNRNPVIERFILMQDEVMSELKKRGIVSDLLTYYT